MEDRLATFKDTIQQSQQYLKQRIEIAQRSLEENQQERFDAEMAVVWYDVNICEFDR